VLKTRLDELPGPHSIRPAGIAAAPIVDWLSTSDSISSKHPRLDSFLEHLL